MFQANSCCFLKLVDILCNYFYYFLNFSVWQAVVNVFDVEAAVYGSCMLGVVGWKVLNLRGCGWVCDCIWVDVVDFVSFFFFFFFCIEVLLNWSSGFHLLLFIELFPAASGRSAQFTVNMAATDQTRKSSLFIVFSPKFVPEGFTIWPLPSQIGILINTLTIFVYFVLRWPFLRNKFLLKWG